MFTAFGNDNSSFKKGIFAIVILMIMAFATSFFLFNRYVALANDNERLKATYVTNNQWIQKFDFGEAVRLQKSLLKPCNLLDVEKVQQDQLLLLQNHHLTVLSVKNEGIQQNSRLVKGKTMRFVKTSIVVQGTWADITAALNEFEKKHLVVITNINLSNESFLSAKIEYNTYYI